MGFLAVARAGQPCPCSSSVCRIWLHARRARHPSDTTEPSFANWRPARHTARGCALPIAQWPESTRLLTSPPRDRGMRTQRTTRSACTVLMHDLAKRTIRVLTHRTIAFNEPHRRKIYGRRRWRAVRGKCLSRYALGVGYARKNASAALSGMRVADGPHHASPPRNARAAY